LGHDGHRIPRGCEASRLLFDPRVVGEWVADEHRDTHDETPEAHRLAHGQRAVLYRPGAIIRRMSPLPNPDAPARPAGAWLVWGIPDSIQTGGNLRAAHLLRALIERTGAATVESWGRRGLPR